MDKAKAKELAQLAKKRPAPKYIPKKKPHKKKGGKRHGR